MTTTKTKTKTKTPRKLSYYRRENIRHRKAVVRMKAKRKGNRISARELESFGACNQQVVRFQGVFPHGFKINKSDLTLAFDTGLNLIWLVDRLDLHNAWRELQQPHRDKDETVTRPGIHEHRAAYLAIGIHWGVF
jgi:hypothetical protein